MSSNSFHRLGVFSCLTLSLLVGVATLPLGCDQPSNTSSQDGVAISDAHDSADGERVQPGNGDAGSAKRATEGDAKRNDAGNGEPTDASSTRDKSNGKSTNGKSSSDKTDADKNADAAPAAGKRFLWKATKDGSDAVVYLLGSVHVAKKEIYPLGDPIDAAYKSAGVLVLELKMDMATQMQAAQKLMQQGAMPAGKTLDDLLEGETKQKFEQRLKAAGPIGRQARRFKPGIATVFLTMEQLQKAGFDPSQGIDMHFYQRAAKDDKQILALETVDEQVDLFVNMPMKTQLLMLRHYLEEESGAMEKMMTELFKAWNQGDAAAVDKLILDSMEEEEYQPLLKAMFIDRNNAMAEDIAKYFETDKTYFVVVGAGHLVGEKGIVSLLKENKDVTVTQMAATDAED